MVDLSISCTGLKLLDNATGSSVLIGKLEMFVVDSLQLDLDVSHEGE